MRALVYMAPGKVELEERSRPQPRDEETEIAVEVAGVCGSDLSGFLGHSALRNPPPVLGHELVGRLSDGRSIRKEHQVIMSFAYTPADFRRSLDLLIAGDSTESTGILVIPA